MAPVTGAITRTLRGGASDATRIGRVRERLSSALADGETVEFRLRCGGSVGHERPDGTERRLEPEGGGETVVAVTGRRVLILLEGDDDPTTVGIPYADLRAVEAFDGWLGRTLEIAVWHEGVYRVRPARSADLAAVESFVADAAAAWRRTVATLDDCRDALPDLRAALEAGDREGARAHRATVDERLETARARLSRAHPTVGSALEERVNEVETRRYRTRMRGHAARGRRLCERSRRLADESAYTEAYEAARGAREGYERALAIAVEHGFDAVEAIQAAIADLDEAVAALEAEPVAAAKSALARARETDDPAEAVEAWREALAAHRRAIAAGWGTDADFAGDTDTLRRRVAWLVERCIDAHRTYAFALVETGNSFRLDRSGEIEKEHYRVARGEMERARALAAEFRAGDEDRLERELAWIAGLVGDA